MPFESTDELARELIRLRLITPEQLQECQTHDLLTSDPESLIKALEGRHLLTPFQATRLREGTADGLVLGDCKLMYQNASGSFARVYRGCRIPSGEVVGIKLLRQRYQSDPATLAHFHREADLCRRLRHKNIVPIHEVGIDGDQHYFTMEFVEGGNLRDFLRIRGKLNSADLLRCACDMAEGLEYALRQGMTHRDFKLTNVLMSSRGVAKLVDFGLAGDDSSGDENVQAVEYATLEKHTGAPNNDPRSDLFFLGTVLFELATGKPPYPPSKSREERKLFSRYSGIRPVRQADPGVSPSIADVIDRLLKIDPAMRYQSATELLKDLRAILQELAPPTDDSPSGIHKQPRVSTVLCVEHRVKQQDMLREYFSKHGFRVLMLSSWDRALSRLRDNPPDCILILGDAIEFRAETVYKEALQWSRMKSVGCVLVLPNGADKDGEQLKLHPAARVLVQPVKVRDVRIAIVEVLQSNMERN